MQFGGLWWFVVLGLAFGFGVCRISLEFDNFWDFSGLEMGFSGLLILVFLIILLFDRC